MSHSYSKKLYIEKLLEIFVDTSGVNGELKKEIIKKLEFSENDYLLLGISLFFISLKKVRDEMIKILSKEKYSTDNFFIAKKEFLDLDCQFELINAGLKSIEEESSDRDLYISALTKLTEDSLSLVSSSLARTKQKLVSTERVLDTEVSKLEFFLLEICNEVATLFSNVENRYTILSKNL